MLGTACTVWQDVCVCFVCLKCVLVCTGMCVHVLSCWMWFILVSTYIGFVHVTNTSEIIVPQGEACINLVVRSPDGAEMHFKLLMTTSLEKLMQVYAARISVPDSGLFFMYKRSRIIGGCPDSYGMVSGDVIDVMFHRPD